jgi:hypothetical protein
MQKCKNCHEHVVSNFCSRCGQKTSVTRITLPGLISDLPHAIFHVDRGFLFNFSQLFKRPGKAIIEYLTGKRKPFYHPASFLVVSLILNYIVVKVTDLHFYDEGELITMSPLKAKAIKDYDALQWWFLEHTYIYILIAIPASTLFLFMIFKMRKQQYNLAETAVVVLFTIAQGVLIQTIIYSCFGWIHSGPFLRVIESINMFILIYYASLVIFQLMSKDNGKIGRILFSVIGGIGLAFVWIASAYLLYIMLT